MSPCSPSCTGDENIRTQVHLLPNLAALTVCMWGGCAVGPAPVLSRTLPRPAHVFPSLSIGTFDKGADKDYDLPTPTQQIRDRIEPQGLRTGTGHYTGMVGELFKNAVEISGLPPQTLMPLVWVTLKHSQVANHPEMPRSGQAPI